MLPVVVIAEVKEPVNCEERYHALSDLHSHVLENYKHGSEEFFTELHDIENKLFDTFEVCPGDPLLFDLMAEIQISLDNPQLAYLYAKKAHRWNPDIWQTNHMLGTTLCMMEQYEEGIPFLKKAAMISPGNASLQFNLCSAQLAAKQYSQAVEACTELLDMKGHDLQGPAYFLRGKAYRFLGKEAAAEKDFSNARLFGFRGMPEK